MTFIEYVVGVYVGAGENSRDGNGNVESWDYSGYFLNYRGIISFRHFVVWGILGLLVSYIHPKLLRRVKAALDF